MSRVGAVRGFETHLISRATFGWTPQLEREVLDLGWRPWLDQQLAPGSIPDTKVDRLLAGYQTLHRSNWQNHTYAESFEGGWERLLAERAHATFLRAMYSRRQLHEVMVEFWTNHVSLTLDETPGDHLVTADNRTVARAHALGRFADLLSASAHSPAMLVYLDNFVSNANSEQGVNENYGRELLELHTLGIVDGEQPYTEADVRGVSLVMSGWSVNGNDGQHTFQFKPGMHHTGPVSILGGAFSTPGRHGPTAVQDGERLLDVLAHHPATARHLAYKLCRRFVADEPPPALVDRLAQVYLDNDTAIAPVLRALFRSPEFADARGTKVRRGFEILVAYGRALRGTADPDPTHDLVGFLHGPGWGYLSRLGQRLWGHPTPDGYPDTAADWLSADGLLRRWEVAGVVTATWLEGWSYPAKALLAPTGPTVGTWIEGVARRVLGVVTGHRKHGYKGVPAWAEDAVRWLVAKGHHPRRPGTSFRGSTAATRGEVTLMLWKIAGRPKGFPPHRLRDVPRSLEAPVRWARATGTVGALPGRRFRPDRPMSRGQFANATWRMAGRPQGFRPHGLSDVPGRLDAAVRWLVGCDHLAAFPNATFRPGGTISRAEVARVLHRIHDDTPPLLTPAERQACLALFADVPADADDQVPDWLVEWKGHDLLTLLLSLPRFQRR